MPPHNTFTSTTMTAKPKTPLLSYHNITANYGAINALRHVSLQIDEKEIVALIGANGAGKTTLMMSLFSQPAIAEGAIYYAGEPIHQLPAHQLIRRGIAISPEGRRIFPKLSVEENLTLGAYSVCNKLQINQQTKLAYSLFPILHQRRTQRAGTLSGGEQQMLAIARAMMSKPKLFLLDEPSLGLAPQLVRQIFNVLKEIASQGTTIFLVEQNAHHALTLADRGYVMVNGQITMTGTGRDLLNNPDIQSAYLGKH